MYFNLLINLLFTWKYITCIIYDFQRYPFSTDDNDDHDDEFQNEVCYHDIDYINGNSNNNNIIIYPDRIFR